VFRQWGKIVFWEKKQPNLVTGGRNFLGGKEKKWNSETLIRKGKVNVETLGAAFTAITTELQ